MELRNEHAQCIVGQAGLRSEWFRVKTANTVISSSPDPFPLMIRAPSIAKPEDNFLVRDCDTARAFFHLDFGARFVSQHVGELSPKEYRTQVWRELCEIYSMPFSALDTAPGQIHFLDSTRGVIILSSVRTNLLHVIERSPRVSFSPPFHMMSVCSGPITCSPPQYSPPTECE